MALCIDIEGCSDGVALCTDIGGSSDGWHYVQTLEVVLMDGII